jgi:hypothetical protein
MRWEARRPAASNSLVSHAPPPSWRRVSRPRLHATTHWQHTDDLEQRYPGVRVEREVLSMDEGDILTAAGVCCGIDLRLHLRRALYTTPTAYRRAFTR